MGGQALLTSHCAILAPHFLATRPSQAFAVEDHAKIPPWTTLLRSDVDKTYLRLKHVADHRHPIASGETACRRPAFGRGRSASQPSRARRLRVCCSATSAAWGNEGEEQASAEQAIHVKEDPLKAKKTVAEFSGSQEVLENVDRGQNGAESSRGEADGSSFKSRVSADMHSVGAPTQNAAAIAGVEGQAQAQAQEEDGATEEAGEPAQEGRNRFFLLAFFAAIWQAIKNNSLVKILTQWPAWQQRKRLELMEAVADASPKDAMKQAEYYVEVNKVNPQAVIERFERREHATNAQVVVEYLRALYATNAISEYLPDERTGRVSGVQPLLQELRQRASGDSTEPLPPPGLTEQQPLHVLMVDAKPKGGSNRWWLIFKEVLQSTLVCIILFFFWMLLSAWLRKYVNGVTGGVGATPGGMAGASAAYAPKEYSKEILPEKNVKTFKDVRGCDEAKAELEEIVQYLKDPSKFTRLGGKLPKGVLLVGPPGTGKTLLAKAIAGEAGVPFYYRAGSEFEEMFVGVGARRVRSLFQIAKKKAPCIVFIDEIDAIGGSRKQWEGHTKKTLNQLLVEMDGFEANEGIIVLAATNLPETLDPALTRPGRFDRHVVVPNPDVRGRQEILELYLQEKPLSPDIDMKTLARGTPGFSGADLANLVNEAAVKAAKDNKERIETSHLEYAKDKILMGTERRSMFVSEESRRMTAYHESGHAVVALRTEGAHPIHKATIMPRGDALGMVTQLPDKDETSRSKLQMLASLDVCMGGRVAEEMVFGPSHVTSGARSDLQQATSLARHMVCECGMSDEVGPVFVDSSSATLSPSIRKTVDDEVVRLLKEAYGRVRHLLKKHEKELHRLAQELMDKETLTATDIREALAPLAEGGDGALAANLEEMGLAVQGR